MQEALDDSFRDRDARQGTLAIRAKIAMPTRVIALYPGESFTLTLTVEGDRRPVRLEFKGPPGIIRIRAKPRTGYTPLNTHLTIEAEPRAPVGWYLLEILAVGSDRSLLFKEKLLVLILDRVIGKRVLKHLPEMLRITKRLGIQGLFWYILERVYPEGARFKQLHELHKLIVRRDVSKGTTGNILRYMLKKKIIAKKNEVYKSLVHDLKTLESRIDASRIRLHQRRDNTYGELGKSNTVPQQVYWAFDRAQRIKNKHGMLAAMYFLIYTLVGVRQTGFLLLWIYNLFVYCEQKTGFCHYFISQLLSEYFKMLGVQQGVLYSQSREHEKARRIAQKYIKKYYRSFRAARRLHYLLKEKGFIDYGDQDVYTLEILYYQDGGVGVRIWDTQKKEAIEEMEVREESPVRAEYRSAFPEEHIHEPNEETYFHRAL